MTFVWNLVDLNADEDISGALKITENPDIDIYKATLTAPVVVETTKYRLTLEVSDGTVTIKVNVIITIEPLVFGEEGEAVLNLDKDLVSVNVDAEVTVIATAFTKEGSPDTLIIDSSNEAVATASLGEDGKTITITGIAKGQATIVVTAETSRLTETVTVNVVKEGEASLILGEAAVSVLVGESVEVGVIAIDAEGNTEGISVESLDSDVAEASFFGDVIKIEGVGAGVTEVLVTSDSGEADTIDVVVTSSDDQTILVFDDAPLTMLLGSTEIIDIIATTSDGSDDTVTATSNNTGVATVALTGFTLEVNAVGTGVTTIAVESGSGLTGAIEVTVFEPGGDPILSLDKKDLTLIVGDSINIGVTALDSDGGQATIAATISPTGIADITVSPNTINVKGVAPGSAALTVTSGAGPTATAAVTVFPEGTVPFGEWDHNSTPPLPGSLKWAADDEDECKETEINGIKVSNCWG